jgi:hypothetical protein
MKKNATRGFRYFLSEETIKAYQEKPLELRLRWLYMGNVLRKAYSDRVINAQDKFREGKI